MDCQRNIVLIGMMGSGKTTCGRLLAERLGRPFVDCDEWIERSAGRTISELFAAYGEWGFRELERRAVRELSSQNNLVIAAGGGTVLRQDNVDALRQSGVLVFLHRPAEESYDGLPTGNRPLAQGGRQAFLATYARRLPAYLAAADLTVEDFSSPQATVEEVLDRLSRLRMRFLVINGPNLNLLGSREPGIYGDESYDALCRLIREHAQSRHASAVCFQSNHEGAIIDQIHAAQGVYDAIVINPGAYTHYSYAILDALKAVSVPAYEVHISHIDQREPFRAVSVTAPACVGQIYGHGFQGYLMAMDHFLEERS